MSILDDVMGEYGFEVPKAAYDKLQEHIAARPPVGVEPRAFVPVHPRNGPLWADTYPAGDAADGRSPRYDRMPLYAAPPAPAAVPVDEIYYVVDKGQHYAEHVIPFSAFGQPALFIERKKADGFCKFANGTGRKHEVRIFSLATQPQPAAANKEESR